MGRDRVSISELELRGSPNMARALKLRQNTTNFEKRAELEKLFNDTLAVYEHAIADVKERGTVLRSTRYTSKGTPYEVEAINHYWRVSTKAESQLTHLAKLLSKLPAPEVLKPGSAEAMFPDLFEEDGQCKN